MEKEFAALKIMLDFEKRKLSEFEKCLCEYNDYYIKTEEFRSEGDYSFKTLMLKDAIRFCGCRINLNYPQTIMELHNNPGECMRIFDSRWLISTLLDCLPRYIFDKNFLAKLVTSYSLLLDKNYDITEAANAIVNFLNYIVKSNNFNRTFTIIDLYNKYLEQQHKMKLNELKRFLKLSANYTKRLQANEKIENLLDEVIMPKDFSILKREKFEELLNRDLTEELDALTYAYAKLDDEARVETDNEIIKTRIKEMSKR